MTQRPTFMDMVEKNDPEFAQVVSSAMQKANAPGALDAKTKTLITLALDSAAGQRNGVKNLARRARSQGASEAEIKEAIRLAFLVAGLPGLLTGMAAFEA